MVDKKVIKAAQALAEHRSFRLGAEMTGTSSPSFSRYIKEAETFTKNTLFERGGGVFPTAAGRQFLMIADQLETALDQFDCPSIGWTTRRLGDREIFATCRM